MSAGRAMMWASLAGRFWAYKRPEVPDDAPAIECDVIEVETGRVWLARRYIPTGWKDTDPRYTHVEFPRCTTGSGPGERGDTFFVDITTWPVPLPRTPYPAQTCAAHRERVMFRLRVRRALDIERAAAMVRATLAAYEDMPRDIGESS